MSKKKTLFFRGRLGVATINIGGVSSVIYDRATLAPYFTFEETDIASVTVVGDDIIAEVRFGNWGINVFGGTGITSIEDVDSVIVRFAAAGVFNSITTLTSVILNGITGGRSNTFFSCTELSGGNIQMNSLMSVDGSMFRNLKNAPGETLHLPSLIDASARYSFGQVNCNLDFPVLELCDLETFRMLKYDLNAPSLTQIGATSGNDLVFSLCANGCSVTVPSEFASNDGGSPDGDLIYLESQGGTVNYI